ncbi:MAG: sigma-70 family RNA polymerase sigma factor, partial [Planctomycetota bacterium]
MAEPVEPDPAGELEALLYEQGGAMHRLARSLATDANAADDLVQDSALAALRKPAGEIERPGAWFAGTLKRIAARRWRDRERRTRRERENARPEALPSSAELLAQREVLADVMQAIRELDEIYARPLLLLYFHDMSAEEVARALGVPAATVRTRHRRALEKLRQKLDRNHGARESWCALLLALPRGGARSASSASSASALTWIATGVGGAALLVLAWLWWPERAATEPAAASATGAVAAVAADELAAPAARAPLRERALAAADAPPTAATPTADATRVSGRVRDPLGAGVPFAQIRRGDRNDELRARPRAICDAT